MLDVTSEEQKALKELVEKFCSDKQLPKDPFGVEPWANGAGAPFLRKWLSARGFNRVRVPEAGIWKFGNVPLHVDDIFSDKYWVVMFPLVGKGDFYWVNKDRIIEKRFHELERPIIFNDKKPHNFYSDGLCYAILGIIPTQVAKKLLHS